MCHRKKKIYLTIELLFARGHGATDSIRFLTHKNDIDKPLITILQTHVSDKLKQVSKQRSKSKHPAKTETSLEWLKELVLPDPPDQLESFAPPLCLIRSTKPSPRLTPRISFKSFAAQSYQSLDPFQKLSRSLRQEEFVEFPLIEVWEKDAFIDSGFSESDQNTGLYEKVEETDGRPRKRRKVEIMGKKRGEAIVKGLLGGYGSSEEEEEEENVEQASLEAMVGLDQYEESEGERELGVPNLDAMEDSEGGGSGDEVMDPAALIQQLKSAGFEFDSVVVEDEELDWGDDEP